MTSTPDELKQQFRSFHRRYDQITDIPESPRSLLSVIEHTLGNHRKSEVYVNKMLAYFLNPSESHGMGTDFLRAVLDGLPSSCGFEEDTFELGDVVVDDQVAVGSGYVDLVIQVEREWFLMIELKFRAAETGTVAYRSAPDVGGANKSEYQSGHYYLYLHHRDEPQASESDFANWTWNTFITDVLRDFCFKNGPRYPQRTTTQLREFIDDIKEITGMSDQQPRKREKIQLYIDNYAAIHDVTKVFDKHWKEFSKQWQGRLEAALQNDGFDTDNWHLSLNHSEWGRIFRHGWHTHIKTFETLSKRASDRKDARIIFHHRLKRNKVLAIRDRKLKFYFRHCGSNDTEFRAALNKRFDARTDEIRAHLPSTARLTGKKRDKIEATYDIQTDHSTDFFEAYIQALKQALIDLAADNEPLLTILTQNYQEAFEEVYGCEPVVTA